jgi:hypothetical protein
MISRAYNRNSKHKTFAEKSCMGKVPHKSMLAAEYIFDRMSGKNSHLLEIYKCSFCEYYHIGHNKLKDGSAKNKKVETK